MDDIACIREALIFYRNYFGGNPADALEALARLEGYVLPAMPAGWVFVELTCHHDTWYFCMHQSNTSCYVSGQGPTPRAAMLAAFAFARGASTLP